VVTAVTLANAQNLRVAVQATGHGACPADSLEDAVLINTRHMRGVKIDPVGRRARVRAGALWADVACPASRFGLAPLAGTAGDVGVVGYTLGGGLGWLGRRHGLACNAVTAIEAVTADGDLVRADHDDEPHLFHALRGQGRLTDAVVTALEFELFPAPELHGGALMWPATQADQVFAAWRDWARTVPDEVTSLCRLLHIGQHSFAMVEVAILGPEDGVLAPLLALDPHISAVRPIVPGGLLDIHNDPKEPTAGLSGHRLLEDAPDGLIAALVALGERPLVSVELRHLRGALARTSTAHGALDRLCGEFSLCAVGLTPNNDCAHAVDRALTRLTDALEPWDTGHVLPNFCQPR
jgi:FAD/FMN-containing dehydrogenase